MNEHVWLVTRGVYSDYHVECVCLTEDEAKAAAAKFDLLEPPSKYGDPTEVEKIRVATADDICSEHVLHLQLRLVPDQWKGKPRAWTHTQVGIGEYRTSPVTVDFDPSSLWLNVRGTDHERVRKVFSEQRAAIIAQIEGVA